MVFFQYLNSISIYFTFAFQCREIAFSCQEALLEDTALLQERMKTYHAKHNDALYAEAKYNQVKNQKCKLEEHLNSKGTNPLDNKKYKQISEQNIRVSET